MGVGCSHDDRVSSSSVVSSEMFSASVIVCCLSWFGVLVRFDMPASISLCT